MNRKTKSVRAIVILPIVAVHLVLVAILWFNSQPKPHKVVNIVEESAVPAPEKPKTIAYTGAVQTVTFSVRPKLVRDSVEVDNEIKK